MGKEKKNILTIQDFEAFAKKLQEEGLPVAQQKADSLYVKYQGTWLSVYRSEKVRRYKVTPKWSWVLFGILGLVGLAFVVLNIKTPISDGGPVELVRNLVAILVNSVIAAVILMTLLGCLYNLTKKGVVRRFCDHCRAWEDNSQQP